MPSKEAHLAQAQRNQEVLDYLLADPAKCAEWIATVAFYEALHLVEALFAHHGVHSHNHEDRDHRLKSDRRYRHIYKHYRPLWAASIVARYLCQPDGKAFSTFADYLPPDRIRVQLVDHRLRQVEKSVQRLLNR